MRKINSQNESGRTTLMVAVQDSKWEVMVSLIPRDSWSDFYRVFDHALPSIRPRFFDSESFSPRVDVIEKDTAFEIIADLPGVAKDDVIITYKNGALTIEASTSKTEETKEPEGITTKEPEGTTTKEPEGRTTKEPEGRTTKEPEGITTKEPEGTTTKEPEGTTTKELEEEED